MQYSRNWQKIKFNIFLQKKVQIMPKRKTHNDWMMLLCGVCLRKEKGLVNINDDILMLIRKHHHDHYDPSLLPRVICKGCCIALRAKERGQECQHNLPTILYHQLKLPVATRLQAEDCQCSFCCICRMSMNEYKAHCQKMRAPPGRPVDKENVDPSSSSPPTPTVICSACKGIHFCSFVKRIDFWVNVIIFDKNSRFVTFRCNENILRRLLQAFFCNCEHLTLSWLWGGGWGGNRVKLVCD